jgi:hypothetical protein
MKARLALLALSAVAVTATEAVAQNQYQQQIAQQFTNWAPRFAQQGFSPQGTPFTGTLNDDADESILISLNAGTRYAIAGVCDNDCSDVDLQVYSSDGTKVGEDMQTDDKPVVIFTAGYSGQYRVKALMATCRTNPCYYGVQVFAASGSGKP